MSVNMLFSVMSLISAAVTIFTVPCSPGPPLSELDKVLSKVRGQSLSPYSYNYNIYYLPTSLSFCPGQIKLSTNHDLVIGETSAGYIKTARIA